MLENALKEQVRDIFAGLDSQYILDITVDPRHESKEELISLLADVASCSEKISCQIQNGVGLEFILLKDNNSTGIKFRGVPNGHEFTSLLLAVLNSDEKGKNLPDAGVRRRILKLKGPIKIRTYVSLSCTNCPDVVQALNIISVLNQKISHEMVDGAINEDEIESLKVQGVPAVFIGDKLIHSGRGDLGNLLSKLEELYGSEASQEAVEDKKYDVVVVGGGPAGSAAAIYSARKGLKVAIIAESVGGQVKETLGIENLISVPSTTGQQLADNLRKHIQEYAINLYENRQVEKVEIVGNKKVLTATGGENFITPVVIIATGAHWRRLDIPGEAEYIGKGVAFCPHCDGPFYKDKHVAVIGGGNSGMEAVLDLAAICSKVSVFEFLPKLKADQVLQDGAKELLNVEIFLYSQLTEVLGKEGKVVGIRVKDRATSEDRVIHLDGLFIQIGLAANSAIFQEIVLTNSMGEIIVDAYCRTNVSGIYAAGDVSTVPYKQIIISMGEGAKAALSAFEDRMRGILD